MEEISRLLGTVKRVRSDSLSSDATQSTASKLALRHRLNQLMTCVDDLDPKTELHQKVVKTLDSAFLSCAKRANKPKKDNFRWTEMQLSLEIIYIEDYHCSFRFLLLFTSSGFSLNFYISG